MKHHAGLFSGSYESLENSRPLILLYVFVLTGGFAAFHMTYPFMIVDEPRHSGLIRFIAAGKSSFDMMEKFFLPMLPGYHFAMAAWAKLTGTNFQALRLVSFLHSLFLVPVVILAARAHRLENWFPRSMQILLLPWLPVMTWLIYTDVASMLYVILGFYFWRTGRIGLSAGALTVACLIRQNNVVWAVAFALIHLVEEAGINPRRLPAVLRKRFSSVLLFIVPVLVVAPFLITEGNLVMGHVVFHPGGFHLTQIYFLALLFFLLFAPVILKDMGRQLKSWKDRFSNKQYLWPVLLVGAYLVYMLTIKNTHPFNQTLKLMNWFFDSDDYVLKVLTMNFLTRSVGFIMLWILGDYFFESVRKSSRPVQLAGFLLASVPFLLPSWLISFRYALIPLALFTLSSDRPAISDSVNLIWYLTLTIAITTAFLLKLIFW